MKFNITIAHEHKLFRCGLISMINSIASRRLSTGNYDASYTIINDVSTPKDLINTLSNNPVDLLLLGYSLNTEENKTSPLASLDGYGLVKWLRNRFPTMKIVVISPHRHASLVRMMLGSGIAGYISMDICEKTLARVMNSVLNNEVYVENDLMRTLLKDPSNDNEISPKEAEVLRLLCKGLSLTNIASHMNLSVKTVSAHKLRAMDKLKVDSDCQLYFLLSRAALFDIKL